MADPGDFVAQALEADGALRSHAKRELQMLLLGIRGRGSGWTSNELVLASRLAAFLDDTETMALLMFAIRSTSSFKGFDGMASTSASEVANWIEAFQILVASNERVVMSLAEAAERRRQSNT